MVQIISVKTTRDYYDVQECAENSLSVAEVMDILSTYPDDAKIVFSNDNGYTYGILNYGTFKKIK